MSRDDFAKILHYLHVNDNTKDTKEDGYFKLRPMIDELNMSFRRYYYPGTPLVVDEDMMPFRGRTRMLQYMPSKPTKYGLKIWKLCDSSDYLYAFSCYPGAGFKHYLPEEWGLGESVVVHLVEMAHAALKPNFVSRQIYTDSYFTSIKLAHHLKQHYHLWLTGCIRSNRIGLPKNMMKGQPLKTKFDSLFYQDNQQLLLCRFRSKKKTVLWVSSSHGTIKQATDRHADGRIVQLNEPDVIKDYSLHMGSVDRHNRGCGSIAFHRRTLRWNNAVFFYLLQCTVVNAWILWKKQTGQDQTLHRFQKRLVALLLRNAPHRQNKKDENHQQQPQDYHRPAPQPLQEVHELVESGFKTHCAYPGCNGRTSLKCKGCNVWLHKKCLHPYHHGE